MVIVTNIYKTARPERMQWCWLPRLSVTGFGSRIEWLQWWFEFYPAWLGMTAFLGSIFAVSIGAAFAAIWGFMKLWY